MFDFVRNRWLFYLLSGVLLVPGLVSLVLPGGLRPGIDFTSGTLMTLRFHHPVEQADLRAAFADLGHGEAIIQGAGDNTYVVRTRTLAQAEQGESGPGASERERIEGTLCRRFGGPDAQTLCAGGPEQRPMEVLNLDQVSPLIASEIIQYAVLAVATASAFILLYLGWAFRGVEHPWRYGTTAVIALVHDSLVVLGVFSILGRFLPVEIEATFIVAILTVIGFSVHDTIVVFDRIRENSIRRGGDTFEDVVNHSLTQTMARSFNTSMSVMLTLVVLLMFGGVTIRTFVLALLIGISVGTYSSIFVASMLLVSWERGELRWLWPFGRRPEAAATA